MERAAHASLTALRVESGRDLERVWISFNDGVEEGIEPLDVAQVFLRQTGAGRCTGLETALQFRDGGFGEREILPLEQRW